MQFPQKSKILSQILTPKTCKNPNIKGNLGKQFLVSSSWFRVVIEAETRDAKHETK